MNLVISSYYQKFEITCSYDVFTEAIEKFLDLSEREQKILTKILKDYEKNYEANVSKIIRKDSEYIKEIQNLTDDGFISFHRDWTTLSMGSEEFIIDQSDDIALAVNYKDGWSLT